MAAMEDEAKLYCTAESRACESKQLSAGKTEECHPKRWLHGGLLLPVASVGVLCYAPITSFCFAGSGEQLGADPGAVAEAMEASILVCRNAPSPHRKRWTQRSVLCRPLLSLTANSVGASAAA